MGSDKTSGLTPLQKEMQRLFERQKLAMAKCCPYCWGSLERETIIQLRCPACGKLYYVEDLINGTA